MADLFEDKALVSDQVASEALANLSSLGVLWLKGGGNCPVQIEGYILDEQKGQIAEFYFRARGLRWTTQISRIGRSMSSKAWQMTRMWPGDSFDAGWMELSDAVRLLERAIIDWKNEGTPLPDLFDEGVLRSNMTTDFDQIKTVGLRQWLEDTSGVNLDIIIQYCQVASPITSTMILDILHTAKDLWDNMNDALEANNDTAFKNAESLLEDVAESLREVSPALYQATIDAVISFYCTPLPDERLWKEPA